MSKDFFDDMIPSQSVDYGELMIYDNQFVEPIEADVTAAKLTIADNTGRIAALEAQIPGGGTGTGAYLNLGGTPDRYPLASECVGQGDDTGFLVVAKPDGMYFYNPVTKQFIPPKKGGGNMAVHGQFPEVFDASHELHHAGRVTRSGIFFSEYDKVGVDAWSDPDKACQVMVTVHELGYEQHVVLGKEGLAYKLFKPGDNNADWVHYQGTPGGGGGTGPVVIDIPFTHLNDVPDTYAGMGGKIVAINAAENGLEFIDAPTGGGGGPVGPMIEDFIDLLDTPTTYVGNAHKILAVNDTENGVEFIDHNMDGVNQLRDELKAAYKSGEHVVNSRSVTGRFLHASTSPSAADVAQHNVIRLSGGATVQATLPKICPHDQDVMADHEIRAGGIIYVHNQTTGNKRFRVTTGDAFMKDEVEVTNAQTLVAGATAVLYPTHNGTKGIWYILSQNTIMPADLAALSMDFTELGDTPDAYTGEGGKLIAVKADMSGLEFVDAPGAGMTEPEVEAKIAQILGGGLNLVNGNGLGGGFAQTSGDVSNTAVAGGSILVGSGSSTGKKFTMPMIVAKDVTTLSNSEVRAGRITYIINMGTQPRTIEKVSGVRFFVNGGHTDTVQTIKAGVCMVFMPGIWGDGTKSWMPIGQFNVAEASGVTSNDLYTGQVKIANRALLYVAYDYNGDIAADKMANNPFIIATGAAGNRILTLPTIMPKLTETLTSTQVREGYRLTVYNQAAGPRTLRLQAGQFFWKDWATNTLDYAIPSKHMEDFLACKVSNNYVWIPMSRRHINNDQARFVQSDKDFLDGIQNGSALLSPQSYARPTTMITGTSFTAEQAVLAGNLICRASTGNMTGTAPTIVPMSQATLAGNEVRLGTEMAVYNHSTTGTVTVNFVNGSQRWNRGSFHANTVISAGRYQKFVATHISGSTYGWVLIQSGETGV